MRRKLAYSTPVLTNSMAKLGSLPQGDWHVSKTGGKLFVGDTNWNRCATLGETVNEAEFHLNKTTNMLIQAQDKTTCRDIAIESKPAYDIYVVGGGASELLRRRHRTVLAPSRLVVGDDRAEYGDGHQDHRIERQFIPRHRGRADLHGDRGQSALAVVGQYRHSADGWRHMLGCLGDVQGRVEPTSNSVTFSGGVAITKNTYLWSRGLLMGAGARVRLTCRGLFSDDDWTVLQAVGVNCFDKDTAIY